MSLYGFCYVENIPTLNMEALGSSETLVISCQTTRRYTQTVAALTFTAMRATEFRKIIFCQCLASLHHDQW
jgi:hypothetical protein